MTERGIILRGVAATFYGIAMLLGIVLTPFAVAMMLLADISRNLSERGK